jgi:hypothetical protein
MGRRYIIGVPKSDNHQADFISAASIEMGAGGVYIRVTSSKKKPKTKANRRPSTKSISPASFGVFTTIVYNTKNNAVKNKFNRFKYRGTNLSSFRRGGHL